ncbi:MAG: extracellular solute-binding protein [Rhodospirillales bacterium]|nr:extracellular solute-binding protein [Rhodospirillales bacterium]MBT4038566.1 extracellular solute-binding protein [Rhodospirillales bacterium]MBT4627407.1 extracellular solute-binding protein [Rhodospirillales bacterium]MBT5351460.1 extracellular solute-binding protein [Rhodospirillales bacterium]MBT5519123.1 extracellular solute-binding protein [Rhodospirillales bacterium]
MSGFNRRNFLQTTGAFALAAAHGGAFPGIANAARTDELNIYCWEGYNSDDVLDPFRRETGAKVRAEGLTSDPDAVNRLRAGETKVWDLINLNNPWAREMMWPEGLIKELDRDRFDPMFNDMMPAFHAPYEWAMDKTGEHLLGMTQRFGPFNFVVNTDKISRAMGEDQGFNIFLDPAMKGKYGILTYDNWNIYHMCVTAGVDPFKSHSKAEIDAYAKVCKQIFNGAKLLTDDLVAMNLALINGEIDAYFTGGTYTASPARFDGSKQVRGITPKSGPMNGKGGIVWIELTSLVNNPNPSTIAEDFLAYVQRPEVSKKVAFAEGTYNPVTQMGSKEVMAQFNKDELDAIQWDTLEEEMSNSTDYDINPDYAEMYDIYSAAKRERES